MPPTASAKAGVFFAKSFRSRLPTPIWTASKASRKAKMNAIPMVMISRCDGRHRLGSKFSNCSYARPPCIRSANSPQTQIAAPAGIHMWTAPVSQGCAAAMTSGRLQSYVRPVWCGRMTALISWRINLPGHEVGRLQRRDDRRELPAALAGPIALQSLLVRASRLFLTGLHCECQTGKRSLCGRRAKPSWSSLAVRS